MVELKDCQLCERGYLVTYVDGATVYGPWANMCVACHTAFGLGLGVGRGQKYNYDEVKQRYVKIEG